MSARDDYPLHRALEMLNGGPSALDEIDRLRGERQRSIDCINTKTAEFAAETKRHADQLFRLEAWMYHTSSCTHSRPPYEVCDCGLDETFVGNTVTQDERQMGAASVPAGGVVTATLACGS